MKTLKTKITQFIALAIGITIIALGVSELLTKAQDITLIGKAKAVSYITGDLPEYSVEVPKKATQAKQYGYNEQVPLSVVKEEIKAQAKEFGLGEQFMFNLAFCESGYNNLAKNPTSTALGVYQYLIGTWQETESFKNHKISRTDYKANIREAMIDISNGEEWRWKECLNK